VERQRIRRHQQGIAEVRGASVDMRLLLISLPNEHYLLVKL